MSGIERKILDFACGAFNRYHDMTGGGWLSETHESFLQNFVAIEISDALDRYVGVDESPNRIINASEGERRGKPRNDGNKRFDIVVWSTNKKANKKGGKKSYQVMSLIEVKKSHSGVAYSALEKDAAKITDFAKNKVVNVKSGYLLVYIEWSKFGDNRRLKNQINKWVNKVKGNKMPLVGSKQMDHHWYDEDNDKTWWCGFMLIRVFKK